ncbi:MAG: MotA/TolQ/ExbB proton channel family protein [Armatimonadaceae bacterium]
MFWHAPANAPSCRAVTLLRSYIRRATRHPPGLPMDKKNPFIAFFVTDWYFAVPMTLMLFIALALVVWRLMLNMSAKTNLDAFLPDLQENLKRKGTTAALALCETEAGLIPKVMYTAGLQASEQGVAAMRRSMQAAVDHEILPRLNFLLPSILAIAKISTMVGLLGTVISMIFTFTAINAEAGKGAAGATGMAAQSEKIGLALFATAFGLMTAIPLVFSHVMFKASIAKFEIKMKLAAQKLVTLVQKAKSGDWGDDEPPPAPDRGKKARARDDDEEDEDDRRRSRSRR